MPGKRTFRYPPSIIHPGSLPTLTALADPWQRRRAHPCARRALAYEPGAARSALNAKGIPGSDQTSVCAPIVRVLTQSLAAHLRIATLLAVAKFEAGRRFEGVDEGVEMVTAAPRTPAVLNLTRAEAHRAATSDGLMLMDVNGVLDGRALTSWSRLLDSAIAEGATGLVVDLRGCRAIHWRCLWALVASAARLKARGDGGISLVTTPGSPLERWVRTLAASRLPAYSSAEEGLRSFRIARRTLAAS